MDVFIKSPNTGDPLVGLVWPGGTTWVDWFHPNATKYWHSEFDYFRQTVEFDGLWIDMNEVTSFCDGECGYGPGQLDLPYVPGGDGFGNITKWALSLNAQHYGNDPLLIEFNTHSLFGYMEAETTASYFTDELTKRPFIISRSTYPTQGRHSGHWLGDNYATWEFMGTSIPGIFNF